MYTLPIGSISTGTLRPEDLLPALADALESVADSLDGDTHELIEDARRVAYRLDNETDHDTDAWENVGPVMDGLFDKLRGYAPPYCYVGAHPGDGSDIGVWPDWDAIEEAEHDGDIFLCKDPSNLELAPPDCDFAAVVNDHGNMTLYCLEHFDSCAEWREAWAII